jgi:hypothetical protein
VVGLMYDTWWPTRTRAVSSQREGAQRPPLSRCTA